MKLFALYLFCFSLVYHLGLTSSVWDSEYGVCEGNVSLKDEIGDLSDLDFELVKGTIYTTKKSNIIHIYFTTNSIYPRNQGNITEVDKLLIMSQSALH